MAEANAGRMDLWTIILDPSPRQALERMKFVEQLGYTGAEIINPVVQLKSDDEISIILNFSPIRLTWRFSSIAPSSPATCSAMT